jgi:hypothetical protein
MNLVFGFYISLIPGTLSVHGSNILVVRDRFCYIEDATSNTMRIHSCEDGVGGIDDLSIGPLR